MSARFNPPSLWRNHLPADFQPATDWIPEVSWGAPPAGWAMWVDSQSGSPASPPQEYRDNPYLFMSVMPDYSAKTAPTAAMPVHAMSGAEGTARFSTPSGTGLDGRPPEGKKPISKGLKIGLGIVGIIVFVVIVGSCVGQGDGSATPAPTSSAPTATPATESPSEAAMAETADASAQAEADAAAETEAAARASAEASDKAVAEASASAEAEADAKAEAEKSAQAEADAKAEAEESAKAEAAAEAKAEAEAGTPSQRNALRAAGSYLEYTAFSRTGLIEQLEFEDYSNKDAKWAVERVSVDWNEQAAKSAENYLDYTAFSRKGLVDQLVFEGFTQKQAEYGVSKTGL